MSMTKHEFIQELKYLAVLKFDVYWIHCLKF